MGNCGICGRKNTLTRDFISKSPIEILRENEEVYQKITICKLCLSKDERKKLLKIKLKKMRKNENTHNKTNK